MKRFLTLLPGVCLALMAFTGKADTLAFNNVPGGGDIGPYSMTLNSTTNLLLFCMNDTDFIDSNESWGVNVVNGADLASFFSSDPTLATEYQEEAYIYSQYNGSNADAVQTALWAVFNPADVSGLSSDALLLYDAATTDPSANPFYSNGDLADYTFYLYNNDPSEITNQYETYPPQNFIGDAPEPPSLLMFGSALLGMAGVVRLKMARA